MSPYAQPTYSLLNMLSMENQPECIAKPTDAHEIMIWDHFLFPNKEIHSI